MHLTDRNRLKSKWKKKSQPTLSSVVCMQHSTYHFLVNPLTHLMGVRTAEYNRILYKADHDFSSFFLNVGVEVWLKSVYATKDL